MPKVNKRKGKGAGGVLLRRSPRIAAARIAAAGSSGPCPSSYAAPPPRHISRIAATGSSGGLPEQWGKSKTTGEEFVFFWQSTSIFSQWYPCQFTVGGLQFNSAEQYMMYQKACELCYSPAAKHIFGWNLILEYTMLLSLTYSLP